MSNIFSSITYFTHYLIESVIKQGDKVIDATAGNGNDTLYLAQKVGDNGKVFAFDIQEQALANTYELLKQNGMLNNVELLNIGHEFIDQHIDEKVNIVMFNLGYLPKADHSLVTKPETTLEAIKQAMNLLQQGGLITITVYIGHPGGDEEAEIVETFTSSLDKKKWDVLKWSFSNRKTAPYLIVLFRREV